MESSKQNRGLIKIASEPNHGATFYIYLPRYLDARSEPQDMAKKTPLRKGGKETIHVVEDEPAILSMCMTILEKNGYQVLGAATPGEAIEIVRTDNVAIDLLLTDVVLPEMNGQELANRIKALCPNSRATLHVLATPPISYPVRIMRIIPSH